MSKIKEMCSEELPREKLISNGVSHLTDVELLALILRTGTKGKDIITLSRQILNDYTLDILSKKTYEEFLQIDGVQKGKASLLCATFEISRRIKNFSYKDRILLKTPLSVYNYCKDLYSSSNNEKVMVILVNKRSRVIKHLWMFVGGLDYSYLDIREIVKKVLLFGAYGFFIVHNHPSGDVNPSLNDVTATDEIRLVCDKMKIKFIDHLIIGNNDFYSFADNGLINL